MIYHQFYKNSLFYYLNLLLNFLNSTKMHFLKLSNQHLDEVSFSNPNFDFNETLIKSICHFLKRQAIFDEDKF